MIEFDTITHPAYALVPQGADGRSFRVALDGVEVASLYLDKAAEEWALTADEALHALPPRFTHAAESFPAWADLCAYLGTDLPRPTAAAANTVEDVADLMLAAAGRATSRELRAELARRDTAERPTFGLAVAEHRRLRQACALVAQGIRSGLAEAQAGRPEAGLVLLAEAHAMALHHAVFERAETLPADVTVLAQVRASRAAQVGALL